MCVVFAFRRLFPAILFIIFITPTAFAQPIKIGFLYVFSGRLAHYGYAAKQGATLAIDDINSKGGILGRKVIGVYEDTKLDPATGVKAAEKLIKNERVDVLMGIVSSGVAKAVAPVANEYKVPLIITLAMTPDVTGKICNRYTFRVSLNGPQNLRCAAKLASGMDVKKWTTMGPDYLFGYQCWEYFQKYLKKLKPNATFVSNDKIAYAPVSTTEFGPYIDKVLKSGADGVLVSLYGGNLNDFIRQGWSKGLFDKKIKFLMNLAYSYDVLAGLGMDMPTGVWLGGLYWFENNSDPLNKRFVDAYKAKYRIWPDYNSSGAYSGVLAYAAAAAKAGSIDANSIVNALEGLTLDLPAGMVTIRAEDHQALMPAVWGKTGKYDPKLRSRTIKPLSVFQADKIIRPIDETECKRRVAKPAKPEEKNKTAGRNEK